MFRKSGLAATALAMMMTAHVAQAQQNEITVFGGVQTAPHSTVTHGNARFKAGWEGRSFQMPPYYGIRYTRWQGNHGLSLNFTHGKVYSDAQTRAANNYDILEFTDGSNPLTVNYLHRFAPMAGFTPMLGVGVGVSIPHVEVKRPNQDRDSNWGYQLGGPVLRASAGVNYAITDNWGVLLEYDFTYLMMNVKTDEGRLRTNLIHNAINLGLSYSF